MDATVTVVRRGPWNKGKLVGRKAPLKVKNIWAIRVRLQMQMRTRDLASFDVGIDSKMRGCDLVKLRVRDGRNSQFNSRSRLQPERRLKHGSSWRPCGLTIGRFRPIAEIARGIIASPYVTRVGC